jgi:hypothetical protein
MTGHAGHSRFFSSYAPLAHSGQRPNPHTPPQVVAAFAPGRCTERIGAPQEHPTRRQRFTPDKPQRRCIRRRSWRDQEPSSSLPPRGARRVGEVVPPREAAAERGAPRLVGGRRVNIVRAHEPKHQKTTSKRSLVTDSVIQRTRLVYRPGADHDERYRRVRHPGDTYGRLRQRARRPGDRWQVLESINIVQSSGRAVLRAPGSTYLPESSRSLAEFLTIYNKINEMS